MADNPLLADIPVLETVVNIGAEIEKRINNIYENYPQIPGEDPVTFVNKMSLDPFRISTNITSIDTPVITAGQITGPSTFAITSSPIQPTSFPHTSSDWEVSLNQDMSNPLLQFSSETMLTSAPFNVGTIGYETDYYFRVRYHSNSFVSRWSNPYKITTSAPSAIERPTITTYQKNNGADSFNLIATAFNHPVLTHTRTVWEVSLLADCSINLANIDTTQALTQTTFPVNNIQADTNYYFRVKYYSGNYSSEWSPIVTVKTPVSSYVNTPAIIIDPPLCPYNFNIAASAFDPSDAGMSHTETIWQIATDGLFTNIIENITTAEDLTAIMIPEDSCNTGTEYFVRVKYKSGTIESAWSPAVNTVTGYVYSSKPKRQDLPDITVVTGINDGYIPIKVGANLFGIYQTAANKFGVGKFNFVDKTWTLVATSTINYDPYFRMTASDDTIFFLIGNQTNLFDVVKLNTTTNEWSNITTITKPRAGLTIAYACGFVYYSSALWFMSEGNIASVNISTGVVTVVSSAGKTEGVDLPTGFSNIGYVLLTSLGTNLIYTLATTTNPEVWIYNQTTNTWTKKQNITAFPGITTPTVTSGGKQLLKSSSGIVLVGYRYDSADESLFHWFKRYDEINDTWTDILNLPGLSDFVKPYFEIIDEDIYVTSPSYGITFIPIINEVQFDATCDTVFDYQVTPHRCSFVYDNKLCEVIMAHTLHPQISLVGSVISISMVDPLTWTSKLIHIIANINDYVYADSATFIYGNGKLYFGGGVLRTNNSSDTPTNKLYQFDIATETLTTLDTTGETFFRSGGCYYDNKLFFVGGRSENGSTTYRRLRFFDLVGLTWSTHTEDVATFNREFPFLLSTPLGILINGGSSDTVPANELEINSLWKVPTFTVETLDPFPTGVLTASVPFVYDNAIYCCGSAYTVGTNTVYPIHKYNDVTTDWALDRDLPISNQTYTDAYTLTTPFILGSRILIMGDIQWNTTIGGPCSDLIVEFDLVNTTSSNIYTGKADYRLIVLGTSIVTDNGSTDLQHEVAFYPSSDYTGSFTPGDVMPTNNWGKAWDGTNNAFITSKIASTLGLTTNITNFKIKLRYRTLTCDWSDWSDAYSYLAP